MKDWQIILAVLVGVLALRFIFRERFQDSPTGVRGPPYNDTDIQKIFGMASPELIQSIKSFDKVRRGVTMELNTATQDGREKVFDYMRPYFSNFYSSVYTPATVPLTKEQVEQFLATQPTAVWMSQTAKSQFNDLLVKYFVNQPHGPPNIGATGPTGGTQQSSSTGTTGTGTTGTTTTSTGTTGTTQQTTTTPGQASGNVNTTTTPGQASGNVNTTTGGSTTSAWGPSGDETGGRGFNVFGPEFAGVGESTGGGVNGYDSTRTTSYPELIGGRIGPSKTRVDGLGMINPSVNAPGMNANLPDWNTLGRSLMPGDQDPYRVSQTFSPSSYSSRGADPVPFLTDFSAFLK